jgi:hypothetical protein
MSKKVATNIRLEKDHLKQLKRISVEQGTSLAKLFERMTVEYLDRVSVLTGKDWRKDPFFQIGSQPGRSGQSSLSESHNRTLYRSKH